MSNGAIKKQLCNYINMSTDHGGAIGLSCKIKTTSERITCHVGTKSAAPDPVHVANLTVRVCFMPSAWRERKLTAELMCARNKQQQHKKGHFHFGRCASAKLSLGSPPWMSIILFSIYSIHINVWRLQSAPTLWLLSRVNNPKFVLLFLLIDTNMNLISN